MPDLKEVYNNYTDMMKAVYDYPIPSTKSEDTVVKALIEKLKKD